MSLDEQASTPPCPASNDEPPEGQVKPRPERTATFQDYLVRLNRPGALPCIR